MVQTLLRLAFGKMVASHLAGYYTVSSMYIISRKSASIGVGRLLYSYVPRSEAKVFIGVAPPEVLEFLLEKEELTGLLLPPWYPVELLRGVSCAKSATRFGKVFWRCLAH